ncbi:MAG: hypothetical protein JJD98_13165 [Polaromonas sp.]|nr:hypothetical protein [Polaromonas sp.]
MCLNRVASVHPKRDKPGLAPQHFSTMRAVAEACDRHTEGLQPGALTSHARTVIRLIGRFLTVRFAVEKRAALCHTRGIR